METTQTLVNEICPTATQAWVKKGALLVDVREKTEIDQLAYDVPNIVHIPLGELESRYTELPTDKALVIVCRSGGRSLKAAGFLINHGYSAEKVVNMKHGMIRWAQKGFPVKGDIVSVLSTITSSGCCSNANAPAEAQKKSCSCGH